MCYIHTCGKYARGKEIFFFLNFERFDFRHIEGASVVCLVRMTFLNCARSEVRSRTEHDGDGPWRRRSGTRLLHQSSLVIISYITLARQFYCGSAGNGFPFYEKRFPFSWKRHDHESLDKIVNFFISNITFQKAS